MPPVDDVEVHPSTRRAEGAHPACYNRTELPSSGYYVMEIVVSQEPSRPRTSFAEDSSHYVKLKRTWISTEGISKLCRQIGQRRLGVWEELSECLGCTAPKDLDFIETMRDKE